MDIPKIYDEVLKAYKALGYPISDSKLLISSRPTYTDGKPVPTTVLKPNASGGNAQDDGTIRINPEYRKVMRHWGLRGSGRDFLRTIIGHELGHHIDRTQFKYDSKNKKRSSLLKEIADSGFHTKYTDSYPKNTDPRKLQKELLAEYLASTMIRRLKEMEIADRDSGVPELKPFQGKKISRAKLRQIMELSRALDDEEREYDHKYDLELSHLPDRVLSRWIRRSHGYTADIAGRPVGMVMSGGGDYDNASSVSQLFVRPEFRRRGIARLLLKRIVEDNRKNGRRSILRVSDNNLNGARKLYESEGFRPISTIMST